MIYLILAVLSSAAIALVFKFFGSGEGNRYGIIIGNYLTCIVISMIMIGDLSTIVHAAPVTFLCGSVGGILFVLGLVFMQSSVNVNGATLTSAFGKLGVMVPLAFSFLIFREQPEVIQVIGIVIALAALILINSPEKDTLDDISSATEVKTYSCARLILTCLGNGLADSMAKVFEQTGPRSDDRIYISVVFCVAAVISAFLAYREYRRTGLPIRIKELLAGIAVGVPNYFSSFFLLASVTRLPSFLVYPIFSTGTIIVVMLVSTLLFKERPTKKQTAGIGMILLALVLLNL